MLKKYTEITTQNPINVLTCPTHERYESNLSKISSILPISFYAFRSNSVKNWNEKYAPLPSNYHLLNPEKGEKQLPPDIEFDLVLSQNKFGQFQILYQMANKLRVPMISLEHTLPMPMWSPEVLHKLKQMRGNLNLFISEYSMGQWGWDSSEAAVIHHGIDTTQFVGDPEGERKPHILSVVNDWVNRDLPCGYRLWAEATKGLPVHPVGDTPGLSQPASSTEELVGEYASSSIFINTSQISPIPTALMEAAACGCACVTTSNCMIPEIFKHGETALMGNSPGELRAHCEYLLKNEKERVRLGKNAQRHIQEKFGLDNFLSSWKNYFLMVLNGRS